MFKITLEEANELMNNLIKKGHKEAFKKEIAKFNKMRRKGQISEVEFLHYYDTSLCVYGRTSI